MKQTNKKIKKKEENEAVTQVHQEKGMFDHFCGFAQQSCFHLCSDMITNWFYFYFTSSPTLKVMVCEMDYP